MPGSENAGYNPRTGTSKATGVPPCFVLYGQVIRTKGNAKKHKINSSILQGNAEGVTNKNTELTDKKKKLNGKELASIQETHLKIDNKFNRITT